MMRSGIQKVLSPLIMWFAALVFSAPLLPQSNAAEGVDDGRRILEQKKSPYEIKSPVLQNRHQSVVRSMDWSSDGRLLVSADNDGMVKVWTSEGILLESFQAFSEPANVVRFLDEERVVVGAARQFLGSRNLNFDEYALWLGKESWFFETPGPTLRVFSLDGRILAEAQDFTEDISDIEISRTQKLIATAGDKGRCWSYDLSLQSEVWSSRGAVSIDVSADGDELALSTVDMKSRESNVRLLSLTGGPLKILFEFFQPITDTVELDPRGEMLAGGSLHGFFLFPRPSSWIMGPRLGPQYVVDAVSDYFLHDFAFSYDGRYLIATTDRAPTHVKVFDRYGALQWEEELELRSGEKYEVMEAFGYAALAPHPFKNAAAVGRNNGDIFFLPIEKAPAVFPDAWGSEFSRVKDIDCSPAAQRAAFATDRGVYEFNYTDLSVRRLSDGPAEHLDYGKSGLSFYGLLREGSNRYGADIEENRTEMRTEYGITDARRNEFVHEGILLDMGAGGISLWAGDRNKNQYSSRLKIHGEDGQKLGEVNLPEHFYPYAAAIGEEGRRIALVYGKSYGFYDYDELELKLAFVDIETSALRNIDTIEAEVRAIDWSDSGELLIADTDSFVRIYSGTEKNNSFYAGPGTVLAAWAGPSRIAILRDRSRDLVLRDLRTGDEKRIPLHHRQDARRLHYDSVHDLVFISYSESIEIVSLDNGCSVLLAFSGDDWVIADERGFFDGSLNADRLAVLTENRQSKNRYERLSAGSAGMNRPDKIAEELGIGDSEVCDLFKRKSAVRLVKAGRLPESISAGPARESFLQTMSAAERRLFSIVYRFSTGEYKMRSGIGKTDLYSLMAVDSFAEFTAFLAEDPRPDVSPVLSVLETKEKSALVRIVLAGAEPAEGKIEVWVNGSSAGTVQIRGKAAKELSVPLIAGENRIEAVFRDPAGRESEPSVMLIENATRRESDLYFVGFGVSDYRDDNLDLLYAAKDARDLAAFFSGIKGFSESHIRIFTDTDCSSDAFYEAGNFLQNAAPEDTVIVFLAGHGVHSRGADPEYYFLPHETDLQHLENTAVNFSVIEDLMRITPALNKLMLMDTCESGELDDEILYRATITLNSANVRARMVRGLSLVSTHDEKENSETVPDIAVGRIASVLRQNRFISRDIFGRSGAVIISASQGGELSFEPALYRRDGNGFFTAAVLQSLSDGSTDVNLDGSISTTELRTYVRRVVSQRTDGRQNPAVDRDNLSADIKLPAGDYGFGSFSQDDLDNALRAAVLNGGIDAVESLLTRGADPNTAYRDQRNVLSVAAAKGEREILLLLLDAGANPRHFDEDRYDCFLHAVKNDQVEIVRLLIEEFEMGRDDDRISVGVNGVFALYLASRYAGLEMTDLLLSAGVHRSLTERSPLCAAAERNDIRILKRLLEAGMDPNMPDGSYFIESPLVRAVRMKNYEAVKLLIDAGADPDASGEEDFPGQRLLPIEAAADIGDYRTFRMLLDSGASITDSCMKKAVKIGAVDIVKSLLHAGVKAKDGHFHTATGLGRLETAKLLVHAGIDPNILDPAHEGNHLVTAAVRDDGEFFEWLLSVDVPLNKPPTKETNSGRPPLHQCLSVLSATNFIGAERAISHFILHGADLNATDKAGRNAYEFAKTLIENTAETDKDFLRLLKP